MSRIKAIARVSRSGKAGISQRGYRVYFVLDFQPEYPKSFCFEDAVSEMVFAFLNGLISVGDAGCYAPALLVGTDDQTLFGCVTFWGKPIHDE